jgi:hypothetical protein
MGLFSSIAKEAAYGDVARWCDEELGALPSDELDSDAAEVLRRLRERALLAAADAAWD